VRDIVGGRSAAYEQQLREDKEIASNEMSHWATGVGVNAVMGANAVVGVDVDYETLGASMLMVSVSDTAVHCVADGQPVPAAGAASVTS
jgi:uncharacterized protein YbjQ (UPF0145 family)